MKRLLEVRLSYRMALIVGIFSAGFLLSGYAAFLALDKLAVNGPVYQRIANGKDLVADILPPPEYIVESYQVALEIAAAPDGPRGELLERLRRLEADYVARHAFWEKQGLEAAVAQPLLDASYRPATAFYALADTEFAEAAKAGDEPRLRAVLKNMKAAYEEHRSAIDTAVQAVNLRNEADEADARKEIGSAGRLLLAIFAGALALGIAVAAVIVRGLLGEFGGEPHDAVAITRRIASGDLGSAIALRKSDDSSLLFSMKAMQQVLGGTVAGIQRAVDSVRIGAQEIASGNMDLSSRTEHHASALEETAATLENLGRNVQQTAVSATHANALSRAASSCAASGRDAMTRVEDMMNSVHASSKRIAEITVEVDGIAFQTNILALNAAVEAARAGPQGAGFAVVAGEVRNLAQRSAVASKTIKKLIDEAAREVAGGQSLVHDAGATMREIADSIDQVSDTIAAISAAAMEQSAGLAEVNIAVAAMEQVTQQNAALVEESAAAAGSLNEQADTLARLAARFIVAPPVAGAQRALAAPLPQLA